jgi:anti-sigma regulatory factor (Ser/Thr protein kinase)
MNAKVRLTSPYSDRLPRAGKGQSNAVENAAESLTLLPIVLSVGIARRFVSRLCRQASLPGEICDAAVLLTSEVVTNAIVHGKTLVTIAVRVTAFEVRVEVADGSLRMPAIRAAKLDDEGGRGLLIVLAVASRWGVQERVDGKTVWFEMGDAA